MGSDSTTATEHVPLRLYFWTCRRFPRVGYTTKVLVVALTATSVPLVAVLGGGAAGLRGPSLVWSAFAGTVAGAVAFLVVLTRLLAPLQLATRQLDDYLTRRSLPAVVPASEDELGLLLNEVGEACHRMEWERIVLEELATTDPLCGVLNRRGGMERIEALRASAPAGARWCVGMLDVDRFKALNDAEGHAAGDRALRAVAGRLADLAVPQAIVCRWGGDEFLVVAASRSEHLSSELGRVIDDLARTGIRTRDGVVPLGVSAGVARGRIDEPLDELIERADDALYEAKRAGGRRVVSHRPHLVVCSSDGILR